MANPNSDTAPDGFLEPWFWNFFLSQLQYQKFLNCLFVGWFGAFWWADGGLMLDRCFAVVGGVVNDYEMAPE